MLNLHLPDLEKDACEPPRRPASSLRIHDKSEAILARLTASAELSTDRAACLAYLQIVTESILFNRPMPEPPGRVGAEDDDSLCGQTPRGLGETQTGAAIGREEDRRRAAETRHTTGGSEGLFKSQERVRGLITLGAETFRTRDDPTYAPHSRTNISAAADRIVEAHDMPCASSVDTGMLRMTGDRRVDEAFGSDATEEARRTLHRYKRLREQRIRMMEEQRQHDSSARGIVDTQEALNGLTFAQSRANTDDEVEEKLVHSSFGEAPRGQALAGDGPSLAPGPAHLPPFAVSSDDGSVTLLRRLFQSVASKGPVPVAHAGTLARALTLHEEVASALGSAAVLRAAGRLLLIHDTMVDLPTFLLYLDTAKVGSCAHGRFSQVDPCDGSPREWQDREGLDVEHRWCHGRHDGQLGEAYQHRQHDLHPSIQAHEAQGTSSPPSSSSSDLSSTGAYRPPEQLSLTDAQTASAARCASQTQARVAVVPPACPNDHGADANAWASGRDMHAAKDQLKRGASRASLQSLDLSNCPVSQMNEVLAQGPLRRLSTTSSKEAPRAEQRASKSA